MVSLLLKHGANPRAIDTIGQSNLQIAFESDPALAAWLLKQIQNVTVIDAAEAGTLDDVAKLVAAGGDVNMASNDIRHLSPLQAAVRQNGSGNGKRSCSTREQTLTTAASGVLPCCFWRPQVFTPPK